MNTLEAVAQNLTTCVNRVDPLLRPWGFVFEVHETRHSHCGPFASGHYVRGFTRIGLSCRDTIDNIYYEHSFVTENRWSREIERFDISHDGLMRGLGHSDDCRLIRSQNLPDAIVARGGGDRVDALLHDLSTFAADILTMPCDEFYEIIRRGRRCYIVESVDG